MIVVLRDVGLGYVFAAPLPMICKTKGYASVKAHILVVVLALATLGRDRHNPPFVKPGVMDDYPKGRRLSFVGFDQALSHFS